MFNQSKLAVSIRALLIGIPMITLVACGDDGNDGNNGVDGSDGLTSLTKVVDMPASTECPHGATKMQAGLDKNNSQQLDDDEVQSESVVCSAAAGAQPLAATARIQFDSVAAPATNYEKRQILVGQAKAVDGNETRMLDVGYHILARSGDEYGDVAFGQLIDSSGQPLFSEDGARKISDSNEFTSLLPIGDRLFSVSQIESRPGAMFMMELDQDKSNGELSVKKLWQLDMSNINGGWVHCAGSVTPWNTHFASEEYEPDARYLVTGQDALDDGYSAPFMEYHNK